VIGADAADVPDILPGSGRDVEEESEVILAHVGSDQAVSAQDHVAHGNDVVRRQIQVEWNRKAALWRPAQGRRKQSLVQLPKGPLRVAPGGLLPERKP
jgi:hypothetical protein